MSVKTRKKRSSKTNKKNKKNINIEILGISMVVFGLLSILSLYNNNMGIIGRGLKSFYTVLFGQGAFIYPLISIVLGIIFVKNITVEDRRNFAILLFLLSLSALLFFDRNNSGATLLDRINNSMANPGLTGGVVGSFMGFFSYRLFGRVGTIFFISLVVLINFYFIYKLLPYNLAQIKERIGKDYNNFKIKRQEHKIERAKAKEAGIEKKLAAQEQSEKIKINEYTAQDRSVIEKFEAIQEEHENIEEEKPKKKRKRIKKSETPEPGEELKVETKVIKEETYKYPSVNFLNKSNRKSSISNEEIIKNGDIIEKTMENFNIDCKVVQINKGPVITCYELQPAPGVKLSKIVSLSDNLAMNLGSSEIRIEAPIPGKKVVGIEVPNEEKDAVTIREIIDSSDFKNSDSDLPLALGKDVMGSTIISSIDKMPHLLIAGATGSGKSVCINGIITSILYKSSPEDVRLMLIDPKVVELNVYNGIPHLLIPVVTDAKKAAFALNWAVEEMEKRYKLFAKNGVRDITSYNTKIRNINPEEEKLPKIVIIVDELADLMMVAASEVEDYISRLAQMARAAGIYLILATQRPSVDVITGTIKANIPSRIAFAVSSAVDSRTILDMGGAEKLLGKGDMLFYPSFYSKPKRVQGAFISDEEIEKVVNSVKVQDENIYEEEIIEAIDKKKETNLKDQDPLLEEAIKTVVADEQASISFLQRKLKVGYSRAARMVDQMEEMGIIGPHEGSKPRKLLLTDEEIKSYLGEINE